MVKVSQNRDFASGCNEGLGVHALRVRRSAKCVFLCQTRHFDKSDPNVLFLAGIKALCSLKSQLVEQPICPAIIFRVNASTPWFSPAMIEVGARAFDHAQFNPTGDVRATLGSSPVFQLPS